jgi:hypothetical protein
MGESEVPLVLILDLKEERRLSISTEVDKVGITLWLMMPTKMNSGIRLPKLQISVADNISLETAGEVEIKDHLWVEESVKLLDIEYI